MFIRTNRVISQKKSGAFFFSQKENTLFLYKNNLLAIDPVATKYSLLTTLNDMVRTVDFTVIICFLLIL